VLVFLSYHTSFALFLSVSTAAPVPLVLLLELLFIVVVFKHRLTVFVFARREHLASSLLPLASVVVLLLDLLSQSLLHVRLQSQVWVMELFLLDLVCSHWVLLHLLNGPFERLFASGLLVGSGVLHHELLYELVPPRRLFILNSLVKLLGLGVGAFVPCVSHCNYLFLLKEVHVYFVLLISLFAVFFLILFVVLIFSLPFLYSLVEFSGHSFLSCVS